MRLSYSHARIGGRLQPFFCRFHQLFLGWLTTSTPELQLEMHLTYLILLGFSECVPFVSQSTQGFWKSSLWLVFLSIHCLSSSFQRISSSGDFHGRTCHARQFHLYQIDRSTIPKTRWGESWPSVMTNNTSRFRIWINVLYKIFNISKSKYYIFLHNSKLCTCT